jgi:hypothetical protein
MRYRIKYWLRSVHTRVVLTTVWALVLSTVLFGQSEGRGVFHLQGTIYGPRQSVAAGAKVQFSGEKIEKIAAADDKGFYEVELPVGQYTMTVQAPKDKSRSFRIFENYVRPLFDVSSPTTLVIDGTLYLARPTCDIAVVNKSGEQATRDQLEASAEDVCGGEDVFEDPPGAGIAFKIYIRYPKRQTTDQGCVYMSDKVYDTEAPVPVFVAYNLLSLEATRVVYDPKSRTIQASGKVDTADGSGKSQHFDSITLKMQNGRAVPVR